MKIWRYMDMPKFVSLISTQSIYFSCISSFDDPYEGWLPDSYLAALSNINRGHQQQSQQVAAQLAAARPDLPPQAIKEALHKSQAARTLEAQLAAVNLKFGANCWHINDDESEAMWRLYGAARAGIAIESTKERLEKSMEGNSPNPVFIDPVHYMDFSNDPIKKGQHRHLMGFIKRKSFEHEKELRALVMLPEPGKGAAIKCDLETLITKVHVAPRAEPYYIHAVDYILRSSESLKNIPVQLSKLLDKPIFNDAQ